MKLEADVSIEVDVTLSGTFVPGYPASGPTYSSGGEPGQPDSVEDVEVDTITAETLIGGRLLRFDLLDGLDDAAKATVRANVLKAVGERYATDSLLESLIEP